MTDFDDSILLLVSNQPKVNPAFGTAFVIARDDTHSYLITCAHVITQINGSGSEFNNLRIAGVDIQPEIVPSALSTAEIDMAMLKVAVVFDKRPLESITLGTPDSDIAINGYSSFENETRSKRELTGKLVNPIKLNAAGVEFSAWDIQIHDDNFSKLSPGYSGSPVYNSKKEVVGIMSHMRTGETGHAICISNLQRLYPDIAQIVPGFKRLTENTRLSQIRTRLLMQRSGEIPTILMLLRKKLSQIEKNGIDEEADFILQVCEQFIRNDMPAHAFISFCHSLEPSNSQQPEYAVLASHLQDGLVNLCFGLDLPALCSSSYLSTQTFYQKLAQQTGYTRQSNSLAELCEYTELNPSFTRKFVLDGLKDLVQPAGHANIKLYAFLTQLQKPFLVIAAGFDSSLIDQLSRHKSRFVTIIPNYAADEKQRYRLCYYPDQTQLECSNEELSARNFFENGYSMVYYPRGVHTKPESLLLSERDYFNANQLLNKKFPDCIKNKLDDLARSLWFLGFHPENWESRFLVEVLRHQRKLNRNKPLVIQKNADGFSKLFWSDCQLYPDLGIDEFVTTLEETLS